MLTGYRAASDWGYAFSKDFAGWKYLQLCAKDIMSLDPDECRRP
jgi:hypothetical protein